MTTNDKDEMIRQAREFSQWADNINVKITIHGPDGELKNLEVIHLLEEKYLQQQVQKQLHWENHGRQLSETVSINEHLQQR